MPATKKEINFIKKNYKKIPTKEISRSIDRSDSFVFRLMEKLGLKVPPKTKERFIQKSRYKKGSLPWNKGIKGLNFGGEETQFKKGHLPANTLYDGAITIRTDHIHRQNRKYYWIRISLNNWMMLHHYLWKKAGRKIPKGKCLAFKNGNPLDCRIGNLEIITRRENLDRNAPIGYQPAPQKYDRYWASRLVGRDRELQNKIIKDHPKLIELIKLKSQLSRIIQNGGKI